MDYLSQILANPDQKRTVTIKTEPSKKDGSPEAPLSADSANLPSSVMDMLMLSQGQRSSVPPGVLQALLMGSGGGSTTPPPAMSPMAGQIPMDQSFNPYGG